MKQNEKIKIKLPGFEFSHENPSRLGRSVVFVALFFLLLFLILYAV